MISRMKELLLLCLTISTVLTTNGQSALQLISPDKTIRVEIKTDNRLTYSVYVDDKKILNESAIDLKLADSRSLSHDMKMIKRKHPVGA